MTNLPENTTYGNTGTQPTVANLSGLTKKIQESTQKNAGMTVKNAITNNFNPATASSIFSPTNTLPADESWTPPINKLLSPSTSGAKIEALPEGYNQFVPVDSGGNWVTPTKSAEIRNWPADMGGGQYVVDPTQPGKMVKSSRYIVDDVLNPGVKKQVLGGLSPRLYEVDHQIPLWAGGADTLGNLGVLDKPTHNIKTKIQSVPLTLLAKGKISLNEARAMAFSWKDKDVAGIPEADQWGYIPVDKAEKIVKNWEAGPSMWKFFNFKEGMQNFGKGVPVLGEFGKGLVGGGTAGIVPGTEALPESGTLGLVSNTAGNIVGTIVGLGKLAKVLGWAIKGSKSLLGITKAVTLGEKAMKAANLGTDIGKVSSAVSKARIEKLVNMSKTAGLLSVWGQIGLTGKEVTGQQEVEFNNHVSQFLNDVAFGAVLGSAGQNVKGYAKVGLGTTALSLMQGEEIVPALQNGALMTALHTMGYKKGIIDPKTRIGNEEAYKMSATTMNQYLGDVIPTVKKGQSVPEVLKLDLPAIEKMRSESAANFPNDTRMQKPITNNAEAIDFMDMLARKKFASQVAKADGTISQEEIKKEMTRIVVAKNQLYNQTLSPEARIQKEWADLLSMGEKLKPQVKSSQLKTNATEILKDVPIKFPEQTFENPSGLKFPTGNVPTTGYGDNIDVTAKQTINDVYNNPHNYSDKIFIVKDPETASIMRLVEQEQIAATGKSNVGNPDEALRVFVKTIDGDMVPVGYMPREQSFDIKKNSLNQTYHEITNRLRHTITAAKSPEDLAKALAKDKAGVVVDLPTATQLFENKGSLKSMSDEDLYAILKPTNAFEKYDSSLNNSALSQEMERNKLNVLVASKDKILPIGGNQARRNPENPYLTLNLNEQDWLRSIALRDGNIKASAPVEQAKQDITTKQNADIVAQNAGNVTKMAKPPITGEVNASVTPGSTPGAPVLPPPSPVARPVSPEAAKVSEVLRNAPKEGKTPRSEDLVDEFFFEMVQRIEYSKSLDTGSAVTKEKSMMDIVNGYKAKNPGMPENDFKNAINDAKSRAKAYVRNEIDAQYKGTKIFGTEEDYSRRPANDEGNVLTKRYNDLLNRERGSGIEGDVGVSLKPFEKTEMKDLRVKIKKYDELGKEIETLTQKINKEGRKATPEEERQLKNLNEQRFTLTQNYLGGKDASLVLANKYGLELTPPNEAGISYLKLDKYGNPSFSREWRDSMKIGEDKTPMDLWGSLLGNEMKVYKGLLSKESKNWAEGITKMKEAKSPYARGFAKSIDEAFKAKFDVKGKDGETKYPWSGSWKLNSALKNLKDWFDMTNQEGQSISQPYRRTAAITAGKNYAEISKNVARADAKTRQATLEAQADRLLRQGGADKADTSTYEGLRAKDEKDIKNVTEDLTPFDIMMNGMINSDARNNLISQYNSLRADLQGSSGYSKPDLVKEMKLLFAQIKKLSADIPDEVKTWKEGGKITLKNNGEPTVKQGIDDGLRVAANIFKKKPSNIFVDFNKIKEMVRASEVPTKK